MREGPNGMENETDMNLEVAEPQKPEQSGQGESQTGEAGEGEPREEATAARKDTGRSSTGACIEDVVHRDNLEAALGRVRRLNRS